MAIDKMGSRFYMQQGNTRRVTRKSDGKDFTTGKVKPKLKADIVKDIEGILDVELPGLDKATKVTLEKLHEALRVHESRFTSL